MLWSTHICFVLMGREDESDRSKTMLVVIKILVATFVRLSRKVGNDKVF